MPPTNNAPRPGEADAAQKRELEGLKAAYERLRDDKVRAEQDLANLTRQLAELETRAKADYGTADPAELMALLTRLREENARLVAEYKAHIQAVHHDLEAVEREFEG